MSQKYDSLFNLRIYVTVKNTELVLMKIDNFFVGKVLFGQLFIVISWAISNFYSLCGVLFLEVFRLYSSPPYHNL